MPEVLKISGAVVTVIGFWFGLDFVFGEFTGWFQLQRLYPKRTEPALRSLGFQYGWINAIQIRGALFLSAGHSGLTIAMWRVMAPLHKPITVPWDQIYAQRVPGLFKTKAQLSFSGNGMSMRIDAASWEALVAVAQERPAYDELAMPRP